MTDFSVGDRVLAPGVVTQDDHGDGIFGVQLLSGRLTHFRTRDLRPDTGGRDLTAQDIQESQETWTGGTAADYRQYAAEELNRIARGDAGSAGDDTAPDSEPQALDTSIQECWICGCDQIQGQPFSGNTEYYCVACDEVIGYPSIATAGPRAGDTAPDDEPRLGHFLAKLDRMINAEIGVLGPREVRAALDEAQATIRRLRSDAAALRDRGDDFARAAGQVRLVNGALVGIDDLTDSAAAWRSAAGPLTTDDPGWVLPEERAAETAGPECTCVPCTSPGRGHPTITHCAACCAGSGIEEYDHDCPVAEHREMAARQFPPHTIRPAGGEQ